MVRQFRSRSAVLEAMVAEFTSGGVWWWFDVLFLFLSCSGSQCSRCSDTPLEIVQWCSSHANAIGIYDSQMVKLKIMLLVIMMEDQLKEQLQAKISRI